MKSIPMKRIPQILILLFVLSSCEKKTAETYCNGFYLENPTTKDSTDYSVINCILVYYYSNANQMHLNQEMSLNTVTSGVDGIKEKLADENVEYDSLILSNYLERNDTSYFLADSLKVNSIHLINPEEIKCLFSFTGNGWEKYFEKYPKSTGILFFSRPGYNALKNQAIIEYNWGFGYDGAYWYLVILDRINGKWTITHRFITGIS
jgi:hypothetical protein